MALLASPIFLRACAHHRQGRLPIFLRPAGPLRRGLTLAAAMALAGALSACAGPQSALTTAPAAAATAPGLSTPAEIQSQLGSLQRLLPTEVLLLGEQHDAPAHQQLQAAAVQWLADRGALAALVMEMAEQGHGSAGLPRDATEAQVQEALAWNDAGWPWASYGPVVMQAVRAGVPVLGGNLPRAQMRAVMGQSEWDTRLPPDALQRQRDAVREGHCDLLPAAQLAPMARIQIARDAAMAATARAAVQPGKTVLLVAGGRHVLRSQGIPVHWEENFKPKVAQVSTKPHSDAINFDIDVQLLTAAPPARDHCAALREQWSRSAKPAPASISAPAPQPGR